MRRYETDLVVMLPTEVRADTSLASPMNGIEVSPDPMGGFQANCELSMRSGLYTAGDAASLPHPICEILLFVHSSSSPHLLPCDALLAQSIILRSCTLCLRHAFS